MCRARTVVALAVSSSVLMAPGLVPAPAVAAVDNHLSLVSVADPEVPLDGDIGSIGGAISNDGRYVVFSSDQPHLVPGDDGDSGRYVYVRDLVAGATTRLSHGTGGFTRGNVAISGNGRYVVYSSVDSAADQSALRLFDRTSGKTRVISGPRLAGTVGIDYFTAAISDYGRTVVYTRSSTVDNVIWTTELYRYDVATGVATRLVEGSVDDSPMASVPSLSADGRYLAFVQDAAIGQALSRYQLVRVDLTTGTRDVIANSAISSTFAVGALDDPTISNSGRFISYRDHVNSQSHVYLYDAQRGASRLVDHDADRQPTVSGATEARVSGNGRYVVFQGNGADYVPDHPSVRTIIVWDRSTDTYESIVRKLDGRAPSATYIDTFAPYVDGDGSTVAFTSTAHNLVDPALVTEMYPRLNRVYVWQR